MTEGESKPVGCSTTDEDGRDETTHGSGSRGKFDVESLDDGKKVIVG